MSKPRRQWQEPPAETPFQSTSIRSPSFWRAPQEEQQIWIFRGPFRLLQAKPKAMIRDSHRIDPQLTLDTECQGVCTLPRFKRLKQSDPQKSLERRTQLQTKNAERWIAILAYLHRYSQLFQKTADSQYQDEHVTNILSSYNQISTARHLQVWQHFTEWCEPFGFHPANISTSFLLDFIYEATYQIRKQSYSMKSLIQSLKFVAHHAEVTKLIELLNAPVINGYITSTKRPQNPREVYPLPFHVAVSFEVFVKDVRRPASSRLILGCYLFMFWTGLRFQDLQRTKPSSLSLTEGILRAVCELSKSGHPQPAACVACGFTSLTYESGWGFYWYDLVVAWTSFLQKSANFSPDFIFPEVQGEGNLDQALIPRPMLYYKAASILRHVIKQPFMCPPYTSAEVSTITVHSTKSALIAAAKQLDLPTHWIAEQGHHRGKRTQGDRYSRDDTIYQLLLQKEIICKSRKGWIPLTPQARGGQHPIPQKHFLLPSGNLRWPHFLSFPGSGLQTGSDLSTGKEQLVSSQQPQLTLTEAATPERMNIQCSHENKSDKNHPDSSSDTSSESSSSSSPSNSKKEPTGPFILNHFTRIAHCTKMKDGKRLPSCGAKLFDPELYRISDEIPEDYDICQRKGCSNDGS